MLFFFNTISVSCANTAATARLSTQEHNNKAADCAMKTQDLQGKTNLWIFGYGSLVWKPGFDYRRSKVGHITGYKRRFWHGDVLYRGDKNKPGRVATLVEDQEACTWGVAYEVTHAQVEGSLQHLHTREVISGGYIMETVQFFPKEKGQEPLLALVYIATADNPIYLGPASDREIAAQIAVCRGTSGHNIEYLVRLAEFMRLHCPEVADEHLFSIEAAVLDYFQDSEGISTSDQQQLLLETE